MAYIFIISTILIFLPCNVQIASASLELKLEKHKLCASGEDILSSYVYQDDGNLSNVTFFLETKVNPMKQDKVSLDAAIEAIYSFNPERKVIRNASSAWVHLNSSTAWIEVNADIRQLCFTGDFTLTMNACKDPFFIRPLIQLNPPRNLLVHIAQKYESNKNWISIKRTAKGKLKLDNLKMIFKILEDLNCPLIKLMFWINSGQHGIVTEKKEIPIGELYKVKEVELAQSFRCKSLSNPQLMILGKFDDYTETGEPTYDVESYANKFQLKVNTIPIIKPMFEWDDATRPNELWLKDIQVDGLKGCFEFAQGYGGTEWKGTSDGFKIDSNYYCNHITLDITVNRHPYSYSPDIYIKYYDEQIHLVIISFPYTQCPDINIELICYELNEKNTSDRTLQYFPEVFKADNGFSIPAHKYINKTCSLRHLVERFVNIAYLDENNLTLLAGISTSLGLLCLALLGFLIFVLNKKIRCMQNLSGREIPIETRIRRKQIVSLLKAKRTHSDKLEYEFERLKKESLALKNSSPSNTFSSKGKLMY